MKANIKVTVTDCPGEVSALKARSLARLVEAFFAVPGNMERFEKCQEERRTKEEQENGNG